MQDLDPRFNVRTPGIRCGGRNTHPVHVKRTVNGPLVVASSSVDSTVQGRRELLNGTCTSGKASTEASFNRHGHPPRPPAKVRRLCKGRGVHEEVLANIRTQPCPSGTQSPSAEGKPSNLKGDGILHIMHDLSAGATSTNPRRADLEPS